MPVLFYLFLFSFFHSLLVSEEPIALYLTWQESPQTTMTIQWITSTNDTQSAVRYWSSDKKNVLSKEGSQAPLPQNTPLLLHRVHLRELTPDTDYSFRLEGHPATFHFRTLPERLDRPLTFLDGGDIYHDAIEWVATMNAIAAKQNPDFAVVGGDLAYAAPKLTLFSQEATRWITWLSCWSKTMVTPAGRLIPLVPVLGNHDVTGRYGQSPDEAPFYYALFALPGNGGYYTLDVGRDFTLIVLDSGHAHPVDGEQAEWLRDTLESRQDVLHKVASYHVPAYPSVRPFSNKRSQAVREGWIPLFDAFGLDLAFEHHDHAYKRTVPLRSGEPSEEGTVYLGDGAWGIGEPRIPHPPHSLPYLAYSAPAQHLIAVTLFPNGSRSIRAINQRGEVFDRLEQRARTPVSA